MYKQCRFEGFHEGAQRINEALDIVESEDHVYYFLWGDNFFDHRKDEMALRRYILATLMDCGHVRASELQKPPLNISHRTLMNWKAILRKEGSSGFFTRSAANRSHKMTEEVKAQCAGLIAKGLNIAAVARQVGIQESTLRKAVKRGAVCTIAAPAPTPAAQTQTTGPGGVGEMPAAQPGSATPASTASQADSTIQGGPAPQPTTISSGEPDSSPAPMAAHAHASASGVGNACVQPSTKSERSRLDAQAASGIGTACTRADERVDAALGLATCASTRFEACADVPMAGLLAGLPALCANGLLSGLGKYLSLPKGFYGALHILLLLAFMALGRIRRPEGLRHIPPGEFGKVIGLDRVPEVRTVRSKIGQLALAANTQAWMKELSTSWMQDDPEEAGYLYIDGHVRVYNGSKAQLPRRFVSRERLCLRGTTDYWVNDAIGRPFFVVSKALNEGLSAVLLQDIVPQLLVSVPQQPTPEQLAADPSLHRFVVVFDREGSHHSLISQLWQQRIGALTYRKNVKDKWPVADFSQHSVELIGGERTTMLLARRQTMLTALKQSMVVIEVRCLTSTGHQSAIITSARHLGTTTVAGRMFARWCQENFFAYMMQHYDIDGLIQYGVEELPGTSLVTNPLRVTLERNIVKTRVLRRQQQSQLALLTQKQQQASASQDSDAGKSATSTVGSTLMHKIGQCVQNIEAVQGDLDTLLAQRKSIARKVTLESLPAEQRPTQLRPWGKMLSDTIKMIAYRSETALVAMLRKHLNNESEARALIRSLFLASGDIEPNDQAGTLTVRIHRMTSPAHDKSISALLDDLTQMEFKHPQTAAKMIFTLI